MVIESDPNEVNRSTSSFVPDKKISGEPKTACLS